MSYELELKKLEGLHTVETVMNELNIKRQSAINLLSKWKKEGHVTVEGGGKLKRIYKITARKQREITEGMFDILNKYSHNMKLLPWFDHQVHGKYGVEDALVDAVQTKSFRVLLVCLRLFAHIKDWKKLHSLAKNASCWQKIGALYDVAKTIMRVRKMPLRYKSLKAKKQFLLSRKYETKEENFLPIEKKWNVPIPFRKNDLIEVT